MSLISLILLLVLLLCFLHDDKMRSLCLQAAKLAMTSEPWRTITLGNRRQNKLCLHSLPCCRSFYDSNSRGTNTVCTHMTTSQEIFLPLAACLQLLKSCGCPCFHCFEI